MEPDRFQQNHKYYIIGIICLVFGLGMFALSVYILHYLAFDWHYTVPDFIVSWRAWLQNTYDASQTAGSWLVFLILFIPAIVLIIVADILSNRIDNQIYGITDKPAHNKRRSDLSDRRESKSLTLRIIVIIILVFIAAEFFQWAITTTP